MSIFSFAGQSVILPPTGNCAQTTLNPINITSITPEMLFRFPSPNDFTLYKIRKENEVLIFSVQSIILEIKK